MSDWVVAFTLKSIILIGCTTLLVWRPSNKFSLLGHFGRASAGENRYAVSSLVPMSPSTENSLEDRCRADFRIECPGMVGRIPKLVLAAMANFLTNAVTEPTAKLFGVPYSPVGRERFWSPADHRARSGGVKRQRPSSACTAKMYKWNLGPRQPLIDT